MVHACAFSKHMCVCICLNMSMRIKTIWHEIYSTAAVSAVAGILVVRCWCCFYSDTKKQAGGLQFPHNLSSFWLIEPRWSYRRTQPQQLQIDTSHEQRLNTTTNCINSWKCNDVYKNQSSCFIATHFRIQYKINDDLFAESLCDVYISKSKMFYIFFLVWVCMNHLAIRKNVVFRPFAFYI